MELSRERLMAAVVARCRDDHIEPPAPAKVQRLVGRAVTDFEAQFCRSRVERISHATRSRLEDLVADSEGDTGEGADSEGAVVGGRSHFAELKTDPGAPGLESLYELCVLVALRDAVRRREIWVVGAYRWRNPEDELPPDFEDNRDVHYAALSQPQDSGEFIAALKGKLDTSLDRFEQALAEGTTGGVAIVKKHGEPWIRVSPRGKQEEPEWVAATGKHGESEAVLRRVRHLFVNRVNLRAPLVRLVNATFAARDAAWWGEGTACASDSMKFGSWSSNFMTEWHQ